MIVWLTASCDCSPCWADGRRQAGGGEQRQLGEHHHEQRSEGPDGQQQIADGGETSGQNPRHPLLQGEDYMVRAKRAQVSLHPWRDYCSVCPAQGGSDSPANGGGGKWAHGVGYQLRQRPL